jgi:DNA repair exonuclease SbcCD ATPase subunit
VLVVTEIGLSGVADFKPTVLKIAKGVQYLYGKNMLMDGLGNAAGKSVFASSMADIFYDTPMVGEKTDKTKSGVRMIKFKRGQHEIKIQSTFKGRSEHMKIAVDGVEKKGRTPSMTKKMLPRYWPINEEEFRTYGFLTAGQPHPLVMGNSAARKAFFTSFFQLDRLDAEKKVLAAYSSELKKVRVRYNELETTFNAVKVDMLKKGQRLELERQVSDLSARLKILRDKSDTAQRVKSLLAFEAYAKPQIDAALKVCPDLDDLESIIEKLESRIRKAKRANTQAEEYRAYRRALKTWEEAAAKIDTSADMDVLEAAAAKFTSATAELKLYQKLVDPRLLNIGWEERAVAKPETSSESVADQRAKLRHMQEHSRKFSKGVCDECGQPVEKPDPEKIEKLKIKIKGLEAAWSKYEEWVEWKRDFDRECANYDPKAKARDKAERIQNENRANYVLYLERQKLGPKPERVEKPDDAEDIEPLKADLSVLKFVLQHLDNVRALAELTDEQRNLSFDSTKMEQVQDRMSSMKTRLEVHNTVKTRATEMRARLTELRTQLEDEEAIVFALEAYSDTAIKRMAVEAISEQMMATVNKMASIVFTDYRFEFVWDSQVRLLVHRRGQPPTDVRKLSGAENMLFTLILVFSLLMFVPSRKRLSLLILDEPCASFHEGMIPKFHALLPHMLTLIPSILIVTPKEYERYPGAKEYTIYRDASGACLKRGHSANV